MNDDKFNLKRIGSFAELINLLLTTLYLWGEVVWDHSTVYFKSKKVLYTEVRIISSTTCTTSFPRDFLSGSEKVLLVRSNLDIHSHNMTILHDVTPMT